MIPNEAVKCFSVESVIYRSLQGRPVSLQLWDVAGSQLNARPCHHALIGSRADGVLYVLDVTSRDSLQAVDEWDRALSRVSTSVLQPAVHWYMWGMLAQYCIACDDLRGVVSPFTRSISLISDESIRSSVVRLAADILPQRISPMLPCTPQYLPPWSCKLLVGHKADLPVYVVNDEALSLYVAGAGGFRGWCLTVGNSDYGDYDVAAR